MRHALGLLKLSRCVLVGAVAVALIGAAAGAARAQTDLYEAAKNEGRVVWYVAQFDADTAQKIASAFEQRYPGVKVDVVRASTGVIFQRIQQEAAANVFAADVFSTPDEGEGAALESKGMLTCYQPPEVDKIAKGLQHADAAGCYHITSAWLVLITYNSKSITAAEAPKDWPDLLDPKWKNEIAIGDPAFSGSVATWVNQLTRMYSWSYFEKLDKQQPRIGRSINETVTALNSGERRVAVGLDVTTLKSRMAGNPIEVVYPTSGSVLMLAPSAVLKQAPHPNAAKLFLNFMMSREFSKVLAANSYHPIRSDMPALPGARSLNDVKTVRPSLQEIEKGNREVIEKFRATFGT